MMYVLFRENRGFLDAFKNATDAYNSAKDTLLKEYNNIDRKICDRRITIADRNGDMQVIILENGKEIDCIEIKKLNF